MQKFYSLKRIAALCIAFTLTLGAFGMSSGINAITGNADENNYDNQLDKLEKQQKELDKKIAEADKKLSEENDNLEAINTKYEALQKKIKNVQAQSEEIENEMVKLDTELRESQVDLDNQNKAIEQSKTAFMERIRAMYVAGGAQSYTDVLVNSADFYDVLMRVELVKRVAEHDNSELDKLIDAKKKIEQTQQRINEQTETLKKKAQEYADKQGQLAEDQKELLELKEQSAKVIEELKKNKDDLSDKSDKLAEEYAKVSKLAETTTTPAADTSASANSKPKTTTTKKTSDGSSSDTKITTKKTSQSSQTTANPSEPTQTTAPNQTAAPSQTTAAPTTTQKPAETEKPSNNNPPSSNSDKIDIVLSYAKSNVGGAYVWGGSNFRATDCSGLVMLSFAQVGISLPHLASSQAYYGSAVSYSDMRPGDVIFFGGSSYSSIYHVAIYIGDGKMVHAQNSATGIVISSVASFSMYNNITVIKRLL